MSYQPSLIQPVTLDAGGRLRVAQLTTLGDLKTLNTDNPLLVENTGTGTFLWAGNKCNMSVTAGQYCIRRSRLIYPYFSGKSQLVEATYDDFQLESNIIKRVGYFNSNGVAPYDSDKDGFWLESDGINSVYRIIISRFGVETLNVTSANWNGDPYAHTWIVANAANFNVNLFQFLWLGGAVLGAYIKTDRGFTLMHRFDYAGTSQDVMMLSPNHSIRYEIRSTTGTGSFHAICAQCSTEGSINESGQQKAIDMGAVGYALTNIATTYPLLGIRKKTTNIDNVIKLIGLSAFVTSANDQLQLTVQINPTLSAPMVWANEANSSVQKGTPAVTGPTQTTITNTVTTPGTKIFTTYIATNTYIPSDVMKDDFLSFIASTIANTSDEIIICGTTITSGITAFASLLYKEF